MDTASAPTTDETFETSLSARETVKALWAYVRPHRWAVALGLLCALVGAAGGLLQPLATKTLVDRLATGETIAGILIALTAVVVLGTAVEAFGAYVLERTAESVVLTARRTLVGRLLRLRIAEWERIAPGDLMSRVTSDTTLLRAVSTQAVVAAATGAVAFVAAIVMMAFLDVVLLGVTLGVVVLVGGAAALVMPRIARATERSQEAVGEISIALERAFGAFRTVKASGAEERETARVEAAARRAWRHGVKSAKWESVAGSADGLAVQLAFLAVLAVGGARVASGEIPVSTLIAFLLYLFYLIEPVSQLVDAVSHYQEGAAAISRIAHVERLSTEPTARQTGALPRQRPAVPGPASVRFEDVSFRYRPGLPYIHQQVGFEVPGTGMTAFVGPSGAGKSTVFALIERFYEATGGRVLVDGKDVQDWSLPELRSAIGYVEQDAPVLAGTLRRTWSSRRPVRRTTTSATSWHGRSSTPSSSACPTAWTPRSDTAVRSCRAASGSASPSPAHCCGGPGCCSLTRRPRSSTRSTSWRCGTSSRSWPVRSPCWWWRTACRRWQAPTGSWSWRPAGSGRWARMRNW